MSAWYVLSAMGFYPVNPASGIYVIGTPHFERAVIEISRKTHFTIIANNLSEANIYIQSATLNGEQLNRCYISHKEIVAGGTLVFTMDLNPNMNWGV
jgi:putative alpha-1,2-mannosidase